MVEGNKEKISQWFEIWNLQFSELVAEFPSLAFNRGKNSWGEGGNNNGGSTSNKDQDTSLLLNSFKLDWLYQHFSLFAIPLANVILFSYHGV